MATVLIVDDRAENRQFLTTLLGYGGHRLFEAEDGVDALARARADRPDLVITDLLMPTMDGFEFVRNLRAEPGLADVKVIFYTATYLESDARGLAEACGVRHILTKPAEPELLLRTVNELLEIAQPAPPPPGELETFHAQHLRLLSMTLAHKAEVVVPRLNAIIDLTMQLASELDPSRLMDMFCSGVRKVLGARFAVVGLARKAQPGDHQIFSSGLDAVAASRLPWSWEAGGPLAQLLEDRRPRRAQSVEQLELGFGFPGARSCLAAAIHSPRTAYGWLLLAERVGGGQFSEEEEHLAAILCGLVGRIYENGSLYGATKRHAEELARSEQRFRQLAENIPEVFLVADVEPFQVVYISPAYERVWGRPAVSLYERPSSWLELVVPEEQAATQRSFERGLQGEPVSYEYRIRREDGEIRWIWAQIFPVAGSGERVERITGLALDVTERKKLDQQLRQSQKMEAVGRLAGGVAHDFNNLLGVIMGCSEGALRNLPVDHPSRPKVEQVLRATERAAGVTRQLLTFSRKQATAPRILDLNVVVGTMERMLRALIGEDIDLAAVRAPGLGRVRADEGEIEQVVMNLAVNARDAMPSGGRLTIETANEELDEGFTREHPDVRPGRYVRLVVSDDGPGIPKEIQSQIFEPFFTTKEVGKGTGLGLSTVYAIVKQAGGHVFLYSEPGQGASFRIYLPRVDAPAEPEKQAPTTIPRGTETVLLVEDEDVLRTVTKEVLESCGYFVLSAPNGQEALRIAGSHDGPIHLVVIDVIMPGLSGPETAAQLTTLRADTKVLFASGYTDDALVRHGVLPATVALLQKPFSVGSLARKVREVLDDK